MKVKIKKLDDKCKIPCYQTEYSAGCDIHSIENVIINPGETKLVRTGFALEIEKGYAGFIFARSGLATKRGLAPANKVGVIDSDYRGEVLVSLHNHSSIQQSVTAGERIAQFVIMPIVQADFIESDILTETSRGGGGFGSTGKN